MSIYMRFDEETLKGIAGITQAEYFHAASASDLKKIYEGLNTKFALERKETEISALFAAAAALLAVASAVAFAALVQPHRLGPGGAGRLQPGRDFAQRSRQERPPRARPDAISTDEPLLRDERPDDGVDADTAPPTNSTDEECLDHRS